MVVLAFGFDLGASVKLENENAAMLDRSVTKIGLLLEFGNESTRVVSTVRTRWNKVPKNGGQAFFDIGEGLTVVSVFRDGARLEKGVIGWLPVAGGKRVCVFGMGDDVSVVFECVANPSKNKAGEGVFLVEGGYGAVGLLGVAPFFEGQTDISEIRVVMRSRASDGMEMVSNGRLAGEWDLDFNSSHWVGQAKDSGWKESRWIAPAQTDPRDFFISAKRSEEAAGGLQ